MTYLSVKQLAARWSVTTKAVWQWARTQPEFPQPVKLSPGCTRWRLDQVEAWEAQRANAAA